MLKCLDTIPGLETFTNYSVSDDGKIYSHKTKKYLKTSIRLGNGCEYERIGLRDSNKNRKTFSVHRLVCLAFKYNDNHSNLTVNHIDENTLNNHVDNLEWMTISENIRYSQKGKTYVGDPNKLLSEYNNSDLTVKQFAEKYNCPLNTMWDVLNKFATLNNNKKRRIFDNNLKQQIISARTSGKKLIEVANQFNCSQSMVSKVFNESKRTMTSDHS